MLLLPLARATDAGALVLGAGAALLWQTADPQPWNERLILAVPIAIALLVGAFRVTVGGLKVLKELRGNGAGRPHYEGTDRRLEARAEGRDWGTLLERVNQVAEMNRTSLSAASTERDEIASVVRKLDARAADHAELLGYIQKSLEANTLGLQALQQRFATTIAAIDALMRLVKSPLPTQERRAELPTKEGE